MDIEMGDHQVFNTTGSVLWKRVVELFQVELKEQYSLMRQDRFTVDNIMKYLYGEQISKIPAYYYNKDMQTKYLDFGSAYLYALHGNGEQHIRKWIRERIMYCDTLLGYNVSSADYITLRSSKLGLVYLDIQTYIPMYVSVKWRDEANNTGLQTKRVGRGETVRFEYNMPTETDQEIIVYAGHYLKSLGDVSNLQPTTMLIANADRLTEIECHSPNLINTDLSECKLLQKIDLSDCIALGTGIGAQPTLNITSCRYLRVCNCLNTKLTAIYTMQSGGNLEEIYYPESIQQVVLTNQTYLKRVGLPWQSNSIYCKNLANVQIENCKAIETIHYPFAEGDGLEFDTLRYTQNLTIKNSLDGLTNMTFQGFSKLKSISLAAMYNLSGLGFDDMMNTAESSTLESVKLSECPLISSITFNITSDFNKVEFAPGTVIDLSGMHSVHTIESNTTIKGLETIIVPTSLTTLNFNGEYGDGESDIINIWSSEVNHNNDNYSGIDLKDIILKYLDMEGLKKVVNGKNFNIKINNVPNMNTNRDGKRLPYFKPEGAIDISDYTKSMRKLLKGVDLNKLTVINLPGHLQYDLSYLFEDAILPNAQQVMDIVDCYPMSDVWSYMLCGADLGFDNTEIVIPTDRPMDISGLFKDTNASTDFLIPENIVDVSEMFKNCSNMKVYVYNWDREFPPENEMQTTDCYFGTGGDLELVEPAWGGLGFYENVVSQITVAIPNNEYTFALIGKANMTSVGYVTWGDGTMTKLTDPGVNYSHTYARAGVYTIRGHFTFGNNQPPHINLRTLVRTVDYIATGTTDLRQAFRNCSGLTSVNLKNLTPVNMAECFVNCYDLVNVDFSTLKTSDVVSMKSMFENCNSLKNINIQFDTSNVTDMSKMFYYCEELETLNVDTFNTNKVTDMNGMFAYCTKLKELNVSHFNTDLVTNMNSLFSDCESLTLLDLTSWNTDKVTDMAYMFRNCTQLPNIDVSSFNTENVTNMAYMFYNNAISDSLSVNHFNVSNVKNISYMFSRCYELLSLDISSWDTKNVTTMQDLFNYNWKLKSINLGQLNTENVTTMSNMFQACYVLEDLDISSFKTSNVKNMSSMFSNCKLLTTLDLKHFNTDKVTDMSYLFNYCSSLTNLDISNWNTSAVTEFTSMFSQCSAIETIDLSSIDTRNATEMSYMFQGCSKLKNIIFSNNFSTVKVKDLKQLFSNCISLQSIDTTKIQTDAAINLSNMFEGCQSLTELNLAHFKTNNVEDMKEMFSKCSNLIDLDISGWNTTNVNNMEQMFSGCSKLTSLDISHFNTEKVINMGGLFSDCLLLSELNLGKLSTVNVVSVQDNDWDNMYGINNMFNNCKSLKSIDVSSFATSKITEFLNVFNNCSSLETIDLSKWDLSSATTLSGMFGGCSKLAEVNLANHNTSKVKNVDNMFNGFGGTIINMENCSFDSVTSTKSFVNAANLTDVIAPLSVKTSIEYTAPNLTNQSLQSIINGLVNTGSAKTLKIGEVNVKKLTTDQLTELQAKNWSVS
jgi:surface protein